MGRHSGCRDVIQAYFKARGIDAHVTAVPPIVESRYEPLDVTCPHGVPYYAEPTSEQIAQWAADGVR